MCIGIKVNKNLIGNLIILLAERCKPLYHTKLLKLLYLIDEESTKRAGFPITWLDYKVWSLGPVNEDIYFSKMEGTNKFSQYIRFEAIGEGKVIIKTKIPFSKGEFSDYDMEVINYIIQTYGQMKSKDLADITHHEESLWNKTRERAGIKFSEENKTSDISLNMVDLVADDEFKKSNFYTALENLQMQEALL